MHLWQILNEYDRNGETYIGAGGSDKFRHQILQELVGDQSSWSQALELAVSSGDADIVAQSLEKVASVMGKLDPQTALNIVLPPEFADLSERFIDQILMSWSKEEADSVVDYLLNHPQQINSQNSEALARELLSQELQGKFDEFYEAVSDEGVKEVIEKQASINAVRSGDIQAGKSWLLKIEDNRLKSNAIQSLQFSMADQGYSISDTVSLIESANLPELYSDHSIVNLLYMWVQTGNQDKVISYIESLPEGHTKSYIMKHKKRLMKREG